MTLVKREDLQKIIQEQDQLSSQIFLLFGERFLTKQATDTLIQNLIEKSSGTVHSIDGDTEDSGKSLARLMSFSLLPGNQIYKITDSKLFLSKAVLSDIWKKVQDSHEKGKQNAAKRHCNALIQAAGVNHDEYESLSSLTSEEWKQLFNCPKPTQPLTWLDELYLTCKNSSIKQGSPIADQYLAAFKKGLPATTFLIITAENVDKRHKLFAYIKKNCFVIDCSVDTGASKGAKKHQNSILQELLVNTARKHKKRFEKQAIDLFFDRVGFHPVAIVMETEKLIHFAGKRDLITRQDIELLVRRNREDALFELTDAFGKNETGRMLRTLTNLLDQGIHGLAILATLRNYIKKQLIFRSMQLHSSPTWHQSMSPNEFQTKYLPALKEKEEWKENLQGHPYALYMSFGRASRSSCSVMKKWLSLLLEAEYRFKSTPLPHRLILENLLLQMIKIPSVSPPTTFPQQS